MKEKRKIFELEKKIYESALLKFEGVDGYDVYNTSIPFEWEGKTYIYGRVERRNEWARSWVKLFEKTGKDTFTLKPNSMIYQLEDPYVSFIDGQIVMGGTHPRYSKGKPETYYGYFYKGTNLEDLYYFTTGPDFMKDIRLVELRDKRIGVFSRPRNEEIKRKYGSESIIGFTVINNLDELSADLIEKAKPIDNLYKEGEWGGCNQCYCLSDRLIGVIGHHCFMDKDMPVYMNVAFIFDIEKHRIIDFKIIGTSKCYPKVPAKIYITSDSAFTSGIVMREDGLVDLYSGVNDTSEGRITIDDPFKRYREVK